MLLDSHPHICYVVYMSNHTDTALTILMEAMATTRRQSCPTATNDEIADSIKASLIRMMTEAK